MYTINLTAISSEYKRKYFLYRIRRISSIYRMNKYEEIIRGDTTGYNLDSVATIARVFFFSIESSLSFFLVLFAHYYRIQSVIMNGQSTFSRLTTHTLVFLLFFFFSNARDNDLSTKRRCNLCCILDFRELTTISATLKQSLRQTSFFS